MSLILYYSNFCEHSKELLIYLARNNNRKDMYFVCIDKREMKPNGQIYVTMPDGQKLLLPKQVEHVPAILLLNHGNRVLFGQDIYNYFHQENEEKKNKATKGNGEPLAFSTLEMGNTMSDNYSYWNMDSDELSAKGNGGTRIMHSYSLLNQEHKIETPPDNYVPDKVGVVNLSKIQEEREKDLPVKKNVVDYITNL